MKKNHIEYEDLFDQAMSLENEGKTGPALALLQDLAKTLSIEGNSSRYARVLVNIGLMEVSLGLYKDALIDLDKARTEFETIGDEFEVAKVSGNIGSCHRDLNQFEEALKWYQDSLRLFTRIHSLEGIADQKSNIGYIYALLG